MKNNSRQQHPGMPAGGTPNNATQRSEDALNRWDSEGGTIPNTESDAELPTLEEGRNDDHPPQSQHAPPQPTP